MTVEVKSVDGATIETDPPLDAGDLLVGPGFSALRITEPPRCALVFGRMPKPGEKLSLIGRT